MCPFQSALWPDSGLQVLLEIVFFTKVRDLVEAWRCSQFWPTFRTSNVRSRARIAFKQDSLDRTALTIEGVHQQVLDRGPGILPEDFWEAGQSEQLWALLHPPSGHLHFLHFSFDDSRFQKALVCPLFNESPGLLEFLKPIGYRVLGMDCAFPTQASVAVGDRVDANHAHVALRHANKLALRIGEGNMLVPHNALSGSGCGCVAKSLKSLVTSH